MPPPLDHWSGGGAAGQRRPPPIAVLGPTNTGKTHYALERMLAHESGMIGLPLRLLAREIYDRIIAARGPRDVALITGEEKIVPAHARYFVCTVEAMPLDRRPSFLAIDEIQLAADLERGRTFTSRLLAARGEHETLFLGSDTMRPVLRSLFPDIRFLSRERLSTLTYAGQKKVSRLPRRSAIVGFSAESVYAIAELIRRQRGGAAVVLGALSPRTRNAQAALYQSGEVDYLVATDAIGMGLNMDIDHVAFAARRKFDGRAFRDLRNDELAQIAGRAGRYMRDGAFGVTADCPALEEDDVAAIEGHTFEPQAFLQWRSEDLAFTSMRDLIASLGEPPRRPELRRARPDEDELALALLARDEDIAARAVRGEGLRLLWDVCQIPDFRKSALDHHARLLGEIYLILADSGRISATFIEPRLSGLDRTDGDIDALSKRIAHVRTWTFLSHSADWLENAGYWQEKSRSIEDRLSDALHEKLTQRFVDRRTSVLLKRLKDEQPVLAGVSEDGEVIVEGQFVGRLMGFEFIVDPRARGLDAKRMRAAAEKALAPVLASRAAAIAIAAPEDLRLADDGAIFWRGAPIARLEKGPTPLRPNIVIRGIDALSPHLRGRIHDRLKDFFAARVELLLGDLIALGQAAGAGDAGALSGQARGVAFRVVENFGAMSRAEFGEELRQLGQDERAKLRNLGLRFGEYTLFMPKLLKPQPARLLTLLWALWSGRDPGAVTGLKPGLVSIPADQTLPPAFYYAAGYRPSGARAVRIDMLERLAGQIRGERKEGEFQGGFEAGPQMMSLVGCSGEDFESILVSLGYRKQTVRVRKPASPVAAPPAPETSHQSSDEPSTETVTALEMPSETSAEAASAAINAAPAPSECADAAAATIQTEPVTPDAAAPLDPGAPQAEATPAQTAAPAANADESLVEVVIWKMAPRRPPARKARPERDRRPREAAGENQAARDGAPRGGGRREAKSDHQRPDHARSDQERSGRQGRPQRRDENRRDEGRRDDRRRDEQRRDGPARGGGPRPSPLMTMPQHRKVADPNSPFAVLAGLKDELAKRDVPPTKKPDTAG